MLGVMATIIFGTFTYAMGRVVVVEEQEEEVDPLERIKLRHAAMSESSFVSMYGESIYEKLRR